MSRFSALLFLILCGLPAACISPPPLDYQSDSGLRVTSLDASDPTEPRMRLIDMQGQSLGGVEVEVWAHEHLVRDSFGKYTHSRNQLGLVPVACGTTDSLGFLPLELAGRTFGVDDAGADDMRLAVYENGRLAHAEFIQEMGPHINVVIPESSRVPRAVHALRFFSPEGEALKGLTLRPLEPQLQSRRPNPYWRCRFGPSDAQGLVYLPEFEKGRVRFAVTLDSGESLELSLSLDKQDASPGTVTELRVPRMMELELDCSSLKSVSSAGLRMVEEGRGRGSWSADELFVLRPGELKRLKVFDTSEKLLQVEPDAPTDSLLRLKLVSESSSNRGTGRRYEFIAEGCATGRGRIEELDDEKPKNFQSGAWRRPEARAIFEENLDDLLYRYRVITEPSEEGTFNLPLFPEAQSRVEVSSSGRSGGIVGKASHEGWHWSLTKEEYLLGVFAHGSDAAMDLHPEPRAGGWVFRGRVVDEEGRPCRYARIDVQFSERDRGGFIDTSVTRKLLFAFSDTDGQFQFQTHHDFDEILVSCGSLDGSFDIRRDSFEPNMVLVID